MVIESKQTEPTLKVRMAEKGFYNEKDQFQRETGRALAVLAAKQARNETRHHYWSQCQGRLDGDCRPCH